MSHVRKAVIFNLSDAHQRELFEWCEEQSSNFSGFVKAVLFAAKQNRQGAGVIIRRDVVGSAAPGEYDNYAHEMSDLL